MITSIFSSYVSRRDIFTDLSIIVRQKYVSGGFSPSRERQGSHITLVSVYVQSNLLHGTPHVDPITKTIITFSEGFEPSLLDTRPRPRQL